MNEKKKFRFNVLDVIIILLIVACVAGIAVRYNLADRIGLNSKKEAVITFTCEGLKDSALSQYLIEGDTFYCAKFNGVFGSLYNVKDFKYDDAKVYSDNESGIVITDTLDYKSDVTGYIKASGRVDEKGGFFVDGTNLVSPGQTYEINSKNRKMSVTVLSIDIQE